jgi:putative oxidoreductase
MKTNLFSVYRQPLVVDIALLLTRLVIGYAFLLVGWGKIQNPTDWMRGITFAPLWQVLAAVAEFGGGLALFLGLLTRLGAFGIVCVMVVAAWVHKFVFLDPYISFTGGSSYQVALAYLSIALLLLVLGPGRFSLDRLFFGLSGEQLPPLNHRKEDVRELESA